MNNKRKTLQTIAGIGAVATVLPNSWVKPVLNSVVLPAHAQTSAPNTLSITGFSESCGAPFFSETTSFDVDDTVEPPVLIEAVEDTGAIIIDVFSVINTEDPDTDTEVQITVIVGDNFTVRPQICPGFTLPETESFELNFSSLSGVNWIATYELSVDGPTVSVSDIILSPD